MGMDHVRPIIMSRIVRTAARLGVIGLVSCAGAKSPPSPEGPNRFVPQPGAAAKAARLEIDAIDKIDVLFVVDNSDSMADKQQALATQFPVLARALGSGDVDGDGVADFPPPTDVQFGVVSTDMGAPGIQGIMNCQELGDDGLLRSGAPMAGCSSSQPSFLRYQASDGGLDQLARDFSCLATLGTGGCGFEQPLEAALKALWPSSDERVSFHGLPGTGNTPGHGDAANAGFSRSAPGTTPSLLVIVVLTDEDDCSAADTTIFTPPQYLDPRDPLVQQGMNLRCSTGASMLYPVERFQNALPMLRERAEQLVLFAAITGVPPDRVDHAAMAAFDYTDAKARESFYGKLLADPRMQVRIDTGKTPDPSDDRLLPVCQSAHGSADPGRRLAQVARSFGENGMVQSICQDDFEATLRFILERIADRMRNPS
jgi:hypothetical protein